MSNDIQIKRRTTGAAGAPASLRSGELAYNEVDGLLYVGYGDNGSGMATSIKTFAKDDFNALRYIPAGGSTGQVMKKTSGSDYAFAWMDDEGSVYTAGFGLNLTDGEFSIDTAEVASLNSPALIGTPTAPTATAGDASTMIATTAFVATAIQNAQQAMAPKGRAKAATTANISLSAPGATIDGVTMGSGDRMLVKNQTDPAENGIYIWNGAAVAATRATDADSWNELVSAYLWIEQGVENGDIAFYCTSNVGGTLGTTAVTWVEFANAVSLQAGTGLVRSGNTLNVQAQNGVTVTADYVELTGQALSFHNLATSGIVVRTGAGTVTGRTLTGTASRVAVTNGDGVGGNPTIDIDSAYVGQASITTLGTIATGVWQGTPVGVAYGGTGANTQSGARSALGLAIGADVQAYHASLGALSGVTGAANQLPYFTSSSAMALTTISSFGRSFMDDADASAARATLELGTMATQDASAVAITGGTINGVVIDGGTF